MLLLPLLLAACLSSSEAPPSPGPTPTAPPAPAPAPAEVTAPPATGLPLQALVATSGEGAADLFDGDPSTGWRPEGEPEEEGLLFRFEEPTRLVEVRVQLCPGSGPVSLESYVDGASNTTTRVNPGGDVRLPWLGDADSPPVRSYFVKVDWAEGTVCLGEVSLVLPPETPGPVTPPRSVAATVAASSTLAPADAYHPGYLFDGRTDFGWVEGAEGLGLGEHLELALGATVDLTGLEIWNGYQRSEDHFKKNARVKALTVTGDDGIAHSLPVADRMGPQVLALPAPLRTRHLRLEIAAATAGTRYQDLVISELRLRDASGPLTLATPDLAQRREALVAETRGQLLERVMAHNWHGFCQEYDSLKLRPNHSFVRWNIEENDADGDQREVFDGAWVVASQGAEQAVIELYGRRHRTQTTWQPYGQDQVRETDRIAGGKVTLRGADDGAGRARLLQLLRDPTFASGPARCVPGERLDQVHDGRPLLLVEGASITQIYVQAL
ncbi:MAG: hypothetical protein ABIO70_36935 [Pseudomonadota bacterium]